jgi:hypothetical protein
MTKAENIAVIGMPQFKNTLETSELTLTSTDNGVFPRETF